MIIHNTKKQVLPTASMLIYGYAGVGKTTLASHLKNVLVINVEQGVLSLKEHEIPYVNALTYKEIRDVYSWLTGSEIKSYDYIFIDSLTEIAEIILAAKKAEVNDGRQAYMKLEEALTELVRLFKAINKTTIFIAKAERDKDENGRFINQPMIPGTKIALKIPYWFDTVVAYRVEEKDKEIKRFFQCQKTDTWDAKGRTGLEIYEKPELNELINKILGETND